MNYDPTTGTFLTRDPLDGVDGTPTTANPYHYADNDPLNKTDPYGLRPKDGEIGTTGTGSGGCGPSPHSGGTVSGRAGSPAPPVPVVACLTSLCEGWSCEAPLPDPQPAPKAVLPVLETIEAVIGYYLPEFDLASIEPQHGGCDGSEGIVRVGAIPRSRMLCADRDLVFSRGWSDHEARWHAAVLHELAHLQTEEIFFTKGQMEGYPAWDDNAGWAGRLGVPPSVVGTAVEPEYRAAELTADCLAAVIMHRTHPDLDTAVVQEIQHYWQTWGQRRWCLPGTTGWQLATEMAAKAAM